MSNVALALFSLAFSDGSCVTCSAEEIPGKGTEANARGASLVSCKPLASDTSARTDDVSGSADAKPSSVAPVATPSAVDISTAMAGGSRGFSAEGAARATADAAALTALGFTMQKTVYATGMLVNETGVANARASRIAHEACPFVSDACDGLESRVQGEGRKDIVVSMRHLTCEASDVPRLGLGSQSGKLRIEGHGDFALTPHAFRQLVGRVGPGGGGGDMLLASPVDLRATVVNRFLKDNARGDKLTIRTRADGTAFAVVSDTYNKCDTDVIARVVREAFHGSDMRARVEYDGARVRIECTAHTNVAPEGFVAGEVFKVSALVRSRDDGGGSLIVDCAFERNLCLNLLIVQRAGRPVARIIHAGNDTARAVRELRAALLKVQSMVRPFLERWGYACSESILEPARAVDNEVPVTLEQAIPGIYRALFTSQRQLVPVSTAEAVKRATAAWHAEPGDTRAALVNGLTRWAHTDATLEPWATDDLGILAGQVLQSRKPLAFLAERR